MFGKFDFGILVSIILLKKLFLLYSEFIKFLYKLLLIAKLFDVSL